MKLFTRSLLALILTFNLTSSLGFAADPDFSTPLPPRKLPACQKPITLTAEEIESGQVNPILLFGPSCRCPSNNAGNYDCSDSPESCDANGGRNECKRCGAVGC